MLLASAHAHGQPSAPTYESTSCSFEGADALGDGVECGTLVVPESWARPTDRSIRLSVAIVRATGSSPAPDPIVYLSGGPGGRGIEDVSSWRERPFARDRDIVLLDQRGTGRSDPLCPEAASAILEIMARDLSAAGDLTENVRVASSCLQRMRERGVDPSAYASAPSARDIDALRHALGYSSWNLLGISYGTRLALTTMREHPAGIRSVVLDSPFPPDVDFYRNLVEDYDRALDHLAADCTADPECRESVGDLKAVYEALERELREHPLRLTVEGVENAPSRAVVVNAADLRFLVSELIVSASGRPVLPALIRGWSRGETESLGALFRVLSVMLESHDVGKYYAVQCTEEMPFSAVWPGAGRPSAREGAPSGDAGGGAQVSGRPTAFLSAARDVCAAWALPAASARENDPVSSALPTLLLSGELDPRAPRAFAERAAEHLEHGTLVVVPGAAHNALGHGCVGDVVASFLEDPSRPVDIACLAERTTAPPLGAIRSTEGPLRMLRAARRGEIVTLLWPLGSLGVLLAAPIVWPARALWRWLGRRRGPAPSSEGEPRAATRSGTLALGAMAAAGLLAWLFAIGLVSSTAKLLGSDHALAILHGLPAEGGFLFVLPKTVVAAVVVGVAAGATGWRRLGWSRAVRAHWIVTTAAAASFVLFLARYDLF